MNKEQKKAQKIVTNDIDFAVSIAKNIIDNGEANEEKINQIFIDATIEQKARKVFGE